MSPAPPPPFEHLALPKDLGPQNKVCPLCVTGKQAIVAHVSCDPHVFQLKKNEIVNHVVFSVEHNEYLAKECGMPCTSAVQTVETIFHGTPPMDTPDILWRTVTPGAHFRSLLRKNLMDVRRI